MANTHHVCFSGSFACSGVNPCGLCHDLVNRNVMAFAMSQSGMTLEQGTTLFAWIEEGWRRLHDQMMRDPRVAERALDVRRIRVDPIPPPMPPAMPAPMTSFSYPVAAPHAYPEAPTVSASLPQPFPPVAAPAPLPAPSAPLPARPFVMIPFPSAVAPLSASPARDTTRAPIASLATATASATTLPAPVSVASPRAASPEVPLSRATSDTSEMTVEEIVMLAVPLEDEAHDLPSNVPEFALNGASGQVHT